MLKSTRITVNKKIWKRYFSWKREKKTKSVLCQNIRTLQKRIERTKAISKGKSTTITCSEKTLIEQISLENESCRSNDVDRAISPLIVLLKFPKRGKFSRKRKSCCDDRLYEKLLNWKKKKLQLKRKYDFWRKKIVHKSVTSSLLTPKIKNFENNVSQRNHPC